MTTGPAQTRSFHLVVVTPEDQQNQRAGVGPSGQTHRQSLVSGPNVISDNLDYEVDL